MSPKMEANDGVGAGAILDSSSDAAGMECASPAPAPAEAVVPLMTQAARPVDDSRRSRPPAVKRKTCLRISTSPPVDSAANANKRTTPSNIAVTAGSSSVVASKGMLFSRAELRPAPLSASRKYDSNVGFGFQPSSASETNTSGNTAAGSVSGSLGCPGDSSRGSTSKASPARGASFNAGSSTTSGGAAAPAARPSDNFATLRKIEARRRAAWSFEPSPRASSSSPPPSLAALGSRSAGSFRRRSPKAGARKSPIPPLPKMQYFAPTGTAAASASASAVAVAAPAARRPPPLPPRRSNNPQLLLSAAYGGPSGRGRGPAAAAAAAPEEVVAAPLSEAPEEVVAAPLSEPAGRGKDRTRETLEQKWAAWQLENQQENQRGPAPTLGKPAPAPAIPGPDRASFGECSGGGRGGGGRKGWGGVGDFHDKVAFLGDYVASVFGRAKRGASVPRRYDGGVQVQHGVE